MCTDYLWGIKIKGNYICFYHVHVSPSQKVLFKMVRQLNTEASVTGKPSPTPSRIPLLPHQQPQASQEQAGRPGGPTRVCLPEPVSPEGGL